MITISRPKAFMWKLRKYNIFVDGSKHSSVADGSTVELNLPAGEHIVYVKVDWYKSNEISLTCGDKDIHLEIVYNFSWTKFWLIPFYALYISTIKRNDAILLKHVGSGDIEKRSSVNNTKSNATTPNLVDTLQKLGELRDKGVISEEEFTAEKKKLLS